MEILVKKFKSFFSSGIDDFSFRFKAKSAIGADLREKFDIAFGVENYDLCAEMIAQGFSASNSQRNRFSKVLFENCRKSLANNKYKKFQKILGDFDEGFKLRILFDNEYSETTLKELMKNELQDNGFIKKVITKAPTEIPNRVKNFCDNLELSYPILGALSPSYKTKEEIEYLYKSVKTIVNLFKDNKEKVTIKNASDLMNSITVAKKYMLEWAKKVESKAGGDSYASRYKIENLNNLKVSQWDIIIESIKELVNDLMNQERHLILAQTKHLSKLNSKELLEKELVRETPKEYHIDYLPKEAKVKVEKIADIYKRVAIENNSVAYYESSLLFKDMTKIISKYLSIEDEYRSALKNKDGKTPYELMMGSLEKIENEFSRLVQEANETKFAELSAFDKKVTNKSTFR